MEVTRAARRLLVAGLLIGWAPASVLAQPATAVDPYFEFLAARHLEGEGDNAGALAALQRAASPGSAPPACCSPSGPASGGAASGPVSDGAVSGPASGGAAADPASAEVRAEIAAFQLRHNQRPEAEKAARDSLTIDANNMEANRVLGQILAANADRENTSADQIAGSVRDAITHLERAAAAATGVADPNVNYTLGRLYLRNGQADKATQALARVLSQNPGSRTARLTMAQAQAQNKDLKGAIQTLEEIVDDEPGVAAPLAQYQEQAGLLREAVDSYTRALAVSPTNRQIKARRVLVLYDLKDYSRAATAAAEAQRQHPDDPQFPRVLQSIVRGVTA